MPHGRDTRGGKKRKKKLVWVASTHLALVGRLRLFHHVPVGEGGDGGGVSSLLGAAGTVDLGEHQLLQACRGRQQTATGPSGSEETGEGPTDTRRSLPLLI